MRAIVLAVLLSGCAEREPMGPMSADAGEVGDAVQLDVRPTDAGQPDGEPADACYPQGDQVGEWTKPVFRSSTWTGEGVCSPPHLTTLEYDIGSPYWTMGLVWEWDSDGSDLNVGFFAVNPPTLDDAGLAHEAPHLAENADLSNHFGDKEFLWLMDSSCFDLEAGTCHDRIETMDCTITIRCPSGDATFAVHFSLFAE